MTDFFHFFFSFSSNKKRDPLRGGIVVLINTVEQKKIREAASHTAFSHDAHTKIRRGNCRIVFGAMYSKEVTSSYRFVEYFVLAIEPHVAYPV